MAKIIVSGDWWRLEDDGALFFAEISVGQRLNSRHYG